MTLDHPQQRLQALRSALQARQLDAAVVLSADPHLSEYLPAYWQARAWLSGFNGSAGTLVVTPEFAGLWTDSRYWEQAVHDLQGSGIELMKAGAPDVPSPAEWLAANLKAGNRVAVDGRTLSVAAHRQWQACFASTALHLVSDIDLLADIWTDRPALPVEPVWAHEPPFARRTRSDNLRAIRNAMTARDAQWHLMSSLDDIAWTLNLRGSDVSYNPVFLAHLLVGSANATLFINEDKVSAALRADLQSDGVQIQPYEAVAGALAGLLEGQALLVDPARVTVGVLASASSVTIIEAENPSVLLKACKTADELNQVRAAMEQDGAALCEFFAWFEEHVGSGQVTELDVDQVITKARAQRPHFVTPSFSTIAAYNANGAMPHYQATAKSHACIQGNGLLLIDSGGQYLGGTTDITRVVPVGLPSAEQKRDFTLVLKGHIALAQAVFPSGIPAPMLDPIARIPLWQAGLDFGHGTGHGVGYCLNVHEGPQSISYRTPIRPTMGMQPGMVTSNEPGLYRPGQWGIRIENLVACVPASSNEFGEFLQFETLTLCPIDTRCIDASLLTVSERQWLNAYHDEVRRRLSPLVNGAAATWLEARTQPL